MNVRSVSWATDGESSTERPKASMTYCKSGLMSGDEQHVQPVCPVMMQTFQLELKVGIPELNAEPLPVHFWRHSTF